MTWCSKKQRTVSTSTTEAEYISLGHAAREAIWLRRFLNELKVSEPLKQITLYGDNEASITLTENVESHTESSISMYSTITSENWSKKESSRLLGSAVLEC